MGPLGAQQPRGSLVSEPAARGLIASTGEPADLGCRNHEIVIFPTRKLLQ
jgi:hypothetical protein